MASPWQSGLAKLDDSLQPLQSHLERLHAGLDVSNFELFQSLEQAQQSAAALRDLMLAERSDLSWADRESLEHTIQQLEADAHDRLNQQRRNKLLALADELEAGTVKHRVEARTTALNALRAEAIAELRTAAQAAEQESELPGPEAGEWLLWAAALDEEKDAATVDYLRRNYAALERFAGELDERYWKPAPRPESETSSAKSEAPAAPPDAPVSETAATPVQASSAPEPINHNYRADKTAEGTTTAAMTDAPVTSTVNMFKVPSRKRSSKSEPAPPEPVIEESAPVETAAEEAASDSTDMSADAMPSFGVLSQAKRPAAIWIAAAVGVILLCAVFAGLYHSSAKASNTPGGGAAASTSLPAGASPASTAGTTADPSQSLARQAVEGTQRQTALDLERCKRVNAGSIECWGYVSNVGTDPSHVSLQSVDVVDGKGNTFNLKGAGQLDFESGRTSNINAGAKAKYTVTVPDKDPNAKTLTLYVDVTNPHALEYTFRDIPIS